jgi:hypothetical protein
MQFALLNYRIFYPTNFLIKELICGAVRILQNARRARSKMLDDMEILRRPRHPPAALIERILSVIATLGLVCFGIGLVLFIYGKASSNLAVDTIGGQILVIGLLLVVPRIFFWIAAEIAANA